MNPNQCNRVSMVEGSEASAEELSSRKMIRAKRSVVQGLDDSVNGGGEQQQCGGVFNTKAMIQNYSNFKQSGVPVRFMYYMNGTWVGFSKEVFELLKEGFLAQKIILEVEIEGSKFLFDFLRMLQVDLGNGNVRSISWIDVHKNSFFPKPAVVDGGSNGGSQVPKLVIEVKIDQNSPKRKRDESKSKAQSETESSGSSSDSDSDEGQSNESSCSVVQTLQRKKPKLSEPVVVERRNWSNVMMLKEGDQSYKDIKNIFLSGVKKVDPSINVTSIRRCLFTSPLANARLQTFRKQMESTKAARGVANHKLAWHGTSSEGVATILSHGFGMTSKIAGSHPYGHGIYLSPARFPETSALFSETDHNGEKHALLCRVVMGNAEIVNKGSNQFHPSSEQYDTGVDSIDSPKLYIVWNTHMNTHILPEYVVSYKTSKDHLQEVSSRRASAPHNLSGVHMPFVQLFDMLKSSVPESRYQELEDAYKAHKEGRISKEILIKLLRSIAGDAPIISAIQKFRSMKS